MEDQSDVIEREKNQAQAVQDARAAIGLCADAFKKVREFDDGSVGYRAAMGGALADLWAMVYDQANASDPAHPAPAAPAAAPANADQASVADAATDATADVLKDLGAVQESAPAPAAAPAAAPAEKPAEPVRQVGQYRRDQKRGQY